VAKFSETRARRALLQRLQAAGASAVFGRSQPSSALIQSGNIKQMGVYKYDANGFVIADRNRLSNYRPMDILHCAVDFKNPTH